MKKLNFRNYLFGLFTFLTLFGIFFDSPRVVKATSGIYLDSTGYTYRQNSDDGSGNFTFSNTIGSSCANSFLMAIVSTWADGNGWDNASYGGVPMTDSGIGSQAYVGSSRHMRWQTFVLKSPLSGTRNFHVRNTRGAYSDPATIVLKTFCNVDQTTPLDFVRGGLNSYSGNGIGSGYFNITNDNSLVFFNYILATGGTVTGTAGYASSSLLAYNAFGEQIYNFFTATVGSKTQYDYYYVGGTDTDWARSLDLFVLNSAAPTSNISITSHTINQASGDVSINGICDTIGTGQNQLDIFANSQGDPKLFVVDCLNNGFSAVYPSMDYGTSTIYVIDALNNASLNRASFTETRNRPPSNIEIMYPEASFSKRGTTQEFVGYCEPYYSGGLAKENAVPNTLTIQSGSSMPPVAPSCTCTPNDEDFTWGTFSCWYTARSYGTTNVCIIDTKDYNNIDCLQMDFTDYNGATLVFYPYFQWSFDSGAGAKFEQSSMNIYDTQGINQSAVPLYFTFSEDVYNASSTYIFKLEDYTVSTTSPQVISSSTVADLNLNQFRQIVFERDLSILNKRNLYASISNATGTLKIYQGVNLFLYYHPMFFPTPPIDFGSIFPRMKSTLEGKFIFHQFFQAYDILLANFTHVIPEVVPQFPMKFMSGDNKFDIVVPALDFESAPVKYFATHLRPMGDGLLWLGFIIYVFFRILGAFSPNDKD